MGVRQILSYALTSYNLKFKFILLMETITMLELRRKAGAVIRGLDQGESYVLSYRVVW